MTAPNQSRPAAWFSTADVEVARQRLADNRYGGSHDTSECLDEQDITEIIEIVLTATWQSAVAEKGWEREWGVRYPDGYLLDWRANESGARTHARSMGVDGAVVSRLVGPWEPAEQVSNDFELLPPMPDSAYPSGATALPVELAEQDGAR